MQVFITIDTEFWPRSYENLDLNQLDMDIQRDIYGISKDGEFGVRYQMDVLDSEGLKGVFFIEAISSLVTGVESLREIVTLVESRGHHVELHLHPEWLKWIQPSPLPGIYASNMSQLSLEDQSTLINRGLMLFKEAGLKTPVRAFRAGNYGANHNTLHALAQNGIMIDSSYNMPYLNSDCSLETPEPLLQPKLMNGVLEVPVNCFQDYPGHYRHIQLTAISFSEMRYSLEMAYNQGWKSFVIVSHSFELIRRNRTSINSARADRWVIARFEKLVKYLGQNKDKYLVSGFCGMFDVELARRDDSVLHKPLKGSLLNTSLRWVQQGLRRVPVLQK